MRVIFLFADLLCDHVVYPFVLFTFHVHGQWCTQPCGAAASNVLYLLAPVHARRGFLHMMLGKPDSVYKCDVRSFGEQFVMFSGWRPAVHLPTDLWKPGA